MLPDDHDRPILRICGWCPDVEERTKQAHADGFRVSHTICTSCNRRMLREAGLPDDYAGYLRTVLDPRD